MIHVLAFPLHHTIEHANIYQCIPNSWPELKNNHFIITYYEVQNFNFSNEKSLSIYFPTRVISHLLQWQNMWFIVIQCFNYKKRKKERKLHSCTQKFRLYEFKRQDINEYSVNNLSAHIYQLSIQHTYIKYSGTLL